MHRNYINIFCCLSISTFVIGCKQEGNSTISQSPEDSIPAKEAPVSVPKVATPEKVAPPPPKKKPSQITSVATVTESQVEELKQAIDNSRSEISSPE